MTNTRPHSMSTASGESVNRIRKLCYFKWLARSPSCPTSSSVSFVFNGFLHFYSRLSPSRINDLRDFCQPVPASRAGGSLNEQSEAD